jgi:hypothetical protein
VKHQVAAQQKQRAQTKRKYIASEAAPSASFQAKLEASGGIVPVRSLAKNQLDFSGSNRQQGGQSAHNGAQHTRFDDNGQPVKAEGGAAAAAAAAAPPAATGAASNKSAAQLLREKLKGGGSSSGQPAEQQQQQETADGVKAEPAEGGGGQQDSGPVPEPSPKRVKVEGSQDSDGDKNMPDAVSPSSAAAAAAAANGGAQQQGVKQEGDGTMEDVAALPEDEVRVADLLVTPGGVLSWGGGLG